MWILALLIVGGGLQTATAQEFRLNLVRSRLLALVTLDPAACGASNSIPAECISIGQTLCEEQNGQTIEVAAQFDPNTREVAMLWFRCAVTGEVSK